MRLFLRCSPLYLCNLDLGLHTHCIQPSGDAVHPLSPKLTERGFASSYSYGTGADDHADAGTSLVDPAQADGAKDISAIAGSAGDGGFDHSAWDDLLGRFVRGGAVEYGRWKADAAASAALDAYLASLSSVSLKSLGGRNQRMAFWINAYNACVVDMVLDLMPLRSVMDVEGFFKKKACAVGGAKRSLDDIEKGVLLRAPFGDPRLHFAINCASISCPPLESRAWGSKGLDRRLDRAAGAFIRGGGARPASIHDANGRGLSSSCHRVLPACTKPKGN